MYRSEKYPNLSTFFSSYLNQTAGYNGKDNFGDDLPYSSYEEIMHSYLYEIGSKTQLTSKIAEIDQLLAEDLDEDQLEEMLEQLGFALTLKGLEPTQLATYRAFLNDLKDRFCKKCEDMDNKSCQL